MPYSPGEKRRRKRWKERMKLFGRDKLKAWKKLSRAVKSGKVKKPNLCPRCRLLTPREKMTAHHLDYSMPLLVRWLCQDCHNAEHLKEIA